MLSNEPIFLRFRWPPNVPKEASLVNWGDGGLWQYCQYNKDVHADRCQIWNWGGGLLEDEIFLPYDGGALAITDELKIKNNGDTGSDRVLLVNGRILIPESRYRRVKQFLDQVNGKTTAAK